MQILNTLIPLPLKYRQAYIDIFSLSDKKTMGSHHYNVQKLSLQLKQNSIFQRIN